MAGHAASRRHSIESRARPRQRARMRAVPGAPCGTAGVSIDRAHAVAPPQLPRGPWSEQSAQEPPQHGEHDGEQQEAHRGECGQPELEGVERGELPHVLDILLHAELGLSRHALLESDGHIDDRTAPAAHHELEADLEAHRVHPRIGAARERRLAQAEEA
eukprot:scaffold59538_cov61-Phaeocystis_antarctica.AAC.8